MRNWIYESKDEIGTIIFSIIGLGFASVLFALAYRLVQP